MSGSVTAANQSQTFPKRGSINIWNDELNGRGQNCLPIRKLGGLRFGVFCPFTSPMKKAHKRPLPPPNYLPKNLRLGHTRIPA